MRDYLAQRGELIATAEPGIAAARELCTMTDEAVRDLARAASSPPGRWALVALGGWGAGALLPSSDLDILVLADSGPHLRPFVEQLLYPLWDAGLKVGHQVRSPKEQVRSMRADLATCTAALTARPLEGDIDWAGIVLAEAARTLAKRTRRMLADLATRERPGSPYLLEPHLKEGKGERRDWDELVWTASILSARCARDPEALVESGVLDSETLTELRHHADTVTAARWALQRDGFGDLMTLESTESLPVDPEEVQLALAQTALALSQVRERVADGVGVRSTPAAQASQLTAQEILHVLRSGPEAADKLDEALQAGRAERLLPGYRELMTIRRPGLGHELTVGAHCVKAACLIARTPEVAGDAVKRSYEELTRADALLIATLTHDVGKRQAGAGHSERGAPDAAAAARAFGLAQADAEHAAALVLHHLVLAETAFGADLDDEDAVLRTAAVIGDRDLVAPLHVLTAADSLATGPTTWTEWRAALLSTLVARLDAALSDEVEGAGLAEQGEMVRTAVLGALATATHSVDMRRFVERASLRYLASRTPAQVQAHARAVAELMQVPATERLSLSVGLGPAPETHELTIIAQDRPELFSRITGAISLAGLDILSADAFGAPEGLALDVLVVAPSTRKSLDHATWSSVERFLKAALADRYALKTRLDERRRHYPARARSQTSVIVSPSDYDTAVRVTAPDRPGLLHDLSLAIAKSGFDIRWAKIVTVEGMAVDTFHIVDDQGVPPSDEGELGHLAMRLRSIG